MRNRIVIANKEISYFQLYCFAMLVVIWVIFGMQKINDTTFNLTYTIDKPFWLTSVAMFAHEAWPHLMFNSVGLIVIMQFVLPCFEEYLMIVPFLVNMPATFLFCLASPTTGVLGISGLVYGVFGSIVAIYLTTKVMSRKRIWIIVSLMMGFEIVSFFDSSGKFAVGSHVMNFWFSFGIIMIIMRFCTKESKCYFRSEYAKKKKKMIE